MKRGFARPTPERAPTVKPENVVLPTPMSVPPPEGKPWWLVVVGVLVLGLVIAMVAMTVASGSRMFVGAGSIFPLFMIGGVMAMMMGGRGGSQQLSRPKLDALRAQFMLTLDRLRGSAAQSADSMDTNYRWFHPAPQTLAAAVGSPRMWERRPDNRDLNFGLVRVGVGMTQPEINWSEPQDMPADVDLEPVTGKALQEFGRYQSVVYNLPKMVSLLAEPWCSVVGPREQTLDLARAMICQLAFSHGPDVLRMIVVSTDAAEWDWVKWLPHFGDPRRHDAAGSARMVYESARDFAAEHSDLVFAGRGSFISRNPNSSAQSPSPHYLVIADSTDPHWEYLLTADGIDGVTFLDLAGATSVAGEFPQRELRFTDNGVLKAVPRDRDRWIVIDDELWFFALADRMPRLEAEQFAQLMATWRLAEAYEEISQRVPRQVGARDILSHYGIQDASAIDFPELWGRRQEAPNRSRLRVPFGNRSDNGELLFLDMKSLDEGGDGPHGVMSGTTGSGKSTLLRTVLESLMLGHSPEELQFVLADLKGGSAVKPFTGVPHVSRIITDLEDDQALMERFLEAMWGEIARRKALCDSAGVDGAKEYNELRSRMAARGEAMTPLPTLAVVIDEFYEWFRIMPTAVDVLDSIGRQGRAYWVHLVMASQTIESRAEKLMENMGYRLVLKAQTAGAAQAAGVPNAVNLPAKAGLGYFRKSGTEAIRFQAEFLWRDYHRDRLPIAEQASLLRTVDFIRPQLFTTAFAPIEVTTAEELEPVASAVADEPADVLDSVDADGAIRIPKVGTVILDQLRRIDFEPYRLWQPPLDEPIAVDTLVDRLLGRPWQETYGAIGNLVFPIGLVDRPFKHDQPPWTIDTSGAGANVLILGAGGAGKTTALQTLICAAALTHTPAQVQFYCLAFSGTALTTVAGLPHVGGMAGPTDLDGVRRIVAELLELTRERKRSFLDHDVASMEVFRRRRSGNAPGSVPEDGFGDVYLVIDNYRALAEENEVLIEQVNQLVNQGPSFGVHVIVAAERETELRPAVRSGFGSRVELRLSAVEDARLVRSRFAKNVPVKPGRGMVAVNYVRLDSEPQSGLHTLVARPALAETAADIFESDGVAVAVSRVATGTARPVRRLPARIDLDALRAQAVADLRDGVGAGGIAWAISEFDLKPIYLNFAENPHLMVTGRRQCGRTTALATIMSEIGRRYAPGASSAPPTTEPSAQVWLIDPRRQLLTELGADYVERFAYNRDGVVEIMAELSATLARREPPSGLSAEELLSQSWWSGPEIFVIIDDAQQFPAGFDSPLQAAAGWVSRASDVGLHVIVTRAFGGWASAGSDPMLRALHQANAPLLVMDADPDEGFIRGRMKGGPLPRGRGLLMEQDSGVFVQVAVNGRR